MVLRLFNRIVLSIMLNTSDLSKINKLSVKFCDAVSLSARSLVTNAAFVVFQRRFC